MKTTMNERIRRAALGALLIVGGYLFIWPLQFLSFFSGLMLVGNAIDARGTEFPEDESSKTVRSESAPKPARRKASRKKKSA